jgi:hypothetical protein
VNSRFVLVGATLVAGCLVALAFPAIEAAIQRGRDPLAATRGTLRQLQLGVQSCSIEMWADGSVRPYPQSLNELVERRFLSADILSKLLSSARIEYIYPMTNTSPDPVILVAHTEEGMLFCTLNGRIERHALLKAPQP